MGKVKSCAMTPNTPCDSNLSQAVDFTFRNLQERKTWIKPEFREVEFMATASGGGPDTDGAEPS